LWRVITIDLLKLQWRGKHERQGQYRCDWDGRWEVFTATWFGAFRKRVAVCDIQLESLGCGRWLGSGRHPGLSRTPEDDRIEAVVIASSTNTHAFMMQDAARAGKHIFCEKPLALDLDSINVALAAVEEAGVKLQVGFNRRFDSNFQRVHKLVASGEIGALAYCASRARSVPPPMDYVRVSGGLFLDMMIHDLTWPLRGMSKRSMHQATSWSRLEIGRRC
jgi:predicted dehydrogenase